MDVRDIANSVAQWSGGSGITALIGATAVGEQSPYFQPLLVCGIAAIALAIALWIALLLTKNQKEPVMNDKFKAEGRSAVGQNVGTVNNYFAQHKPAPDPDGVYQHGLKIGSVTVPDKRINEGVVIFGSLALGPDYIPGQPITFQNLILEIRDYKGGGREKAFGQVTMTTMFQVTCQILGRA
jgi:hypothetical protein